ncbi:MAG: beta-lactamase family protein [Verrucomicrobia bacterium]|nr:beta-lactamase family protein [Verrucomicrobiota bacterium]
MQALAQPLEAGTVGESTTPTPTVAGLLEPLLRQHDLPALAAAVVTSRGLEAVGAVGVRKRGTDVAVSTNDLWHLGSDTKAMTATLVGRWVERGKLTWETTPAEVFPELAADFHADYQGVTLRHLLAHRAGVEANLDWPRLAREGTVREQRIEAVRRAFAVKPKAPPGSAYAYSNLGYVVAGAMVERISGVSWEAGMRTEIFAPLGMTRAGFGGLGTPGRSTSLGGMPRGASRCGTTVRPWTILPCSARRGRCMPRSRIGRVLWPTICGVCVVNRGCCSRRHIASWPIRPSGATTPWAGWSSSDRGAGAAY